MPVDDVSFGLFGRDLQRKVENKSYDLMRVALIKKGDPRHPTDQGGRSEERPLPLDPENIGGSVTEACRVFDEMVSAKEWEVPLCDTEVRVEASVWMGRIWIPLAILPAGTSTEWQAIRLTWPREASWLERTLFAWKGWLRTLRGRFSVT